jgi:PleD family two-component response regulator
MAEIRPTPDPVPRVALVCVDRGERRTAVVDALTELAYIPDVPADAEEAVDRLRKNPYDVVVVDETYEGSSPLDNTVMKALAATSMQVRRYIFVAQLGAGVTTLDNATAFSRSVNAVINVNDVGQLAPILRRAIADNDAFYRVFREVLQAAGRR